METITVFVFILTAPLLSAEGDPKGGETPQPICCSPPPRPRMPSKKRTQLPKDCRDLKESCLLWAKENMPRVPRTTEFEKFYDHHTARGSLMLDWLAAWRNWCRKSVEFMSNGRPGKEPRGMDALEEMMQETKSEENGK